MRTAASVRSTFVHRVVDVWREAQARVERSRDTRGFVGVPVPVAALIWATALLTSPSPRAQVVLFLACGVLMVAPLRIPRPRGFALLLFALWPAAVAAAHITR